MNRRFSYTLVILLLLMSCHVTLRSQESPKAQKLFEEGLVYYNMREYREAIKYLEAAIDEEKTFMQPYFILGEVYYEQKNWEEGIRVYSQIISIDPGFHPEVFLYIAEMECKAGKYQDALEHCDTYIGYPNRKPDLVDKARSIRKNVLFAIHAVEHPVPFQPVNLGDSINTELEEYWPSLTADEQMLVFTVLEPKTGQVSPMEDPMQEDFYLSIKGKAGWGKAKNVGYPINTNQNEGAQTVTSDGQYMFFTACGRQDGLGSCDIYVSGKTKTGWSRPMNIGPPVNTSAWETQPSISPDGKTLYFVSNRKGGKGKMDIWMSQLKDDGTWDAPVNLGDSINTKEDETSPFIHQDNQTLYFSSNGRIGMGGLDIFKTVRGKDGVWSSPENLGYPINTNFDENGLVVNARGDRAYFASDRISSKKRDIFEFELYAGARPVPVSYMKGTVFDKDTRQRLVARFELIDLKTSELVMEAYSNNSGEFLVCIPTNHDYALNVSRKGYLFYSDNFTLTGENVKTDPYLKDVPLNPIEVGGVTILKNIFFAFDSYSLLDESKVELDKTMTFLQANPTIRVEIGGHTDARGTLEYNQKLSEDRARAVYQYLVNHGIGAARLTYRGYGETQPMDTNDTEEGMAHNRRTELKVLEVK